MIPNTKDFIDLIVAEGDDALPMCAIIAQHLEIPMLWKRTKVKNHGRKKVYEGNEKLLLTSKKIFYLSSVKKEEKANND